MACRNVIQNLALVRIYLAAELATVSKTSLKFSFSDHLAAFGKCDSTLSRPHNSVVHGRFLLYYCTHCRRCDGTLHRDEPAQHLRGGSLLGQGGAVQDQRSLCPGRKMRTRLWTAHLTRRQTTCRTLRNNEWRLFSTVFNFAVLQLIVSNNFSLFVHKFPPSKLIKYMSSAEYETREKPLYYIYVRTYTPQPKKKVSNVRNESKKSTVCRFLRIAQVEKKGNADPPPSSPFFSPFL